MTEEDENRQYRVLINDEGQYSLWRIDVQIPRGWRDVGKQGTRQECSSYVDEVWTDMRPLSLQRRMSASPSGEH
jgi:MbtH protein